MTCVIGYVDPLAKIAMMAGDSYGSGDHFILPRKDKKIFQRGNWIFGFTTSYRMGQLLRYKLPLANDPDNLDKYIHDDFIRDLIALYKENEYFQKSEDKEASGGNFLIIKSFRLFEICSDFQVVEHSLPFASVGSGFEFALGGLSMIYAQNGRITKQNMIDTVEMVKGWVTTVNGEVDIICL